MMLAGHILVARLAFGVRKDGAQCKTGNGGKISDAHFHNSILSKKRVA
jgi:hypothetical protein